MKKILTIVTLVLMSFYSNAQMIERDSMLLKVPAIDYLQKSKKQKTGAWVLFGVSAVSGISGFAILLKQGSNAISDGGNGVGCIFGGCSTPPPTTYNDKKATGGAVLMGLSGACFISSMALFIASGKNKKRAVSVLYTPMQSPALNTAKGTVISNTVPSVTVRIPL
jgi:FtsH-binding integral membrane protein